MTIPVVFDLPMETRGDHWCGVTFGPLEFPDTPPWAPLASCRLYFRKQVGHTLGYRLRSGAVTEGIGRIVILDAVNWEVEIPEQVLPLAAGKWIWDFKTIDGDGIVRTLYKGMIDLDKGVSYDD